MHSEYWAWILFPYKHYNYRLNLGIYVLYIPGGFVFPIKALEICIYIEIDYDIQEPRASLLLLPKKEYNDIIFHINYYCFTLSQWCQTRKFFLFLLPLPLCHLLFNHLNFLWMSSGLRAKFAVLASSSLCLDQGNLDLLLPEHKITIGRHQLMC